MAFAKDFARGLLEVRSVELEPEKLFDLAQGWKSPTYCDTRIVMSYPHLRSLARDQLLLRIKHQFPKVDAIGGVATGGISMAGILADHMNLPTFYVRPKPKEHGLKKQFEGRLKPKSSVVVIEELINSGKSLSDVIAIIKKEGHEVLGAFSLFTYGFKEAQQRAEIWNIPFYSLTNLNVLCDEALANGYIDSKNFELLKKFGQDPANWYKNHYKKS